MINLAVLLGRLGADPELRYIASGMAVAKVSLATTRSWKDKTSEEWKEETAWHRITVWGAMAERLAQNMVKGDLAYVQGRIKYDKYTGNDGTEKYITEIIADQIRKLADGKKAANGGAFRGPEYGSPTDEPDIDDLPF